MTMFFLLITVFISLNPVQALLSLFISFHISGIVHNLAVQSEEAAGQKQFAQ
jgi:hypothetical protein